MKVICLVLLVSASAFAAPGIMDNQVESDSGMSKMFSYFGSCMDGSSDLTTCLAVKGITALNRAARAQNLEIMSGISLARDPSFNARSGKAISENDVLSSLPDSQEQKSDRLYTMFLESMNNFFGSRNLVVKLPSEEVARAIDEGRTKLKKFGGSKIFLAIGAKLIALLPLFVLGLGILSVKALVVAKVALVLALLLSFSKGLGGGIGGGLLGGGPGLGLLGKVASGSGLGLLGAGAGAATAGGYAGGSASNGGWSSTGAGAGSTYPYARSYDEAQEVAYSAHAPSEQ
jgi:hypothetical protein